MSYDSGPMGVSVVTPAGRRRATNPDAFYGAVSLLLVLVVFVGFAPTFYLRTLFNGAPVPPLNTIHGLMTTAWIAVVPTQAFLMRTRRKTLHRYLGWTSAGVAVGIVAVTPVVMLRFIPRFLATAGATPGADIALTQIFISDVIALPLFAGMLVAALLNRHHGAAHRRWITYAALMLSTPAPGRAGFLLGVGLTGLAVVPAFSIVCALYDRRALGSVHPSTKFALGASVAHAVVPLVLSLFSPVAQLVRSLA